VRLLGEKGGKKKNTGLAGKNIGRSFRGRGGGGDYFLPPAKGKGRKRNALGAGKKRKRFRGDLGFEKKDEKQADLGFRQERKEEKEGGEKDVAQQGGRKRETSLLPRLGKGKSA